MQTIKVLKCDMLETCDHPIAYIDDKGFIYCERHGLQRKQYCRCRKLKPAELRRLQNGETLASY